MAGAGLYDCLVIGGGAAGLSVALGLARVHRTCALISNSRFRNQGIHGIHNVATRDGINPAEFRRIAQEQIAQYKTTDFIDANIVKVAQTNFEGKNAFEATDDTARTWRGRKLVLATGSKDLFPPIEGYKENWPLNIYQCLFCDGHERSHLPRGVLTVSFPMFSKQASMLKYQSTNNASVTIFTNGTPPQDPEIAQTLERCRMLNMKIEERKIKCLKPAKNIGVNVILEDGEEIYQGFLYHKPPTVPVAETFIKDLGLETVDSTHGRFIKVAQPFPTTNVKGVYVAGDAGTFLTSVPVAMVSGSLAAAAASHELNDEDDENGIRLYEETHGK